jgi:hypothetical protein
LATEKVVKLERAKTDGQDLAHASCLDICSNLSHNGDGDFNVQYNKVHVCHEKISSKSDNKQVSCDDGKAQIVESKPSEVSDLCFEKENDISCCPVDNDIYELSDVEIVINSVRAVTLKVPVITNGQVVKVVADTGAEVTVMSEATYFCIPEERRPYLRKAKRKLVVAEAGRKMTTSGVADIKIQIGLLKFEWSIYVAPIGDDLVLGCDVIYDKDITINTRRGLEVLGEWIDCELIGKTDQVARVLLKETVTVLPHSEVILAGHGINSDTLDTRYCSIEPVVEDERNILIARCLVDPHKDTIPIRLVNLERFPVKIKNNYLLGELHPVTHIEHFSSEELSDTTFNLTSPDIKSIDFSKDDTCIPLIPENWNCRECKLDVGNERELAEIPKLPDHLVDLYENSSEKLISHKHKVKFAEVLLQNSDAFARNKLDLGTCSMITHKIDTGGAKPIRQPLRRTPQGFEGEEEKYLKDQIEIGVVKPSKSSWASPVCLVLKRWFSAMVH